MTRLVLPSLLCALALTAACSAPQTSAARAARTPAVPPEAAAAGRKLLGPDSEVLAFGDLAHDGHEQALVVNRMARSTNGSAGDILFWRAGVLEQRGARWTEVLHCDEYLKNSQGYLAGTPLLPVTGWRLHWDRAVTGAARDLYFTPLAGRGAVHPRTIQVRWNPRVARYQSLDDMGEHFLAEIGSLEVPRAELR
jgi:hypothetical protein